VPIRVIADSEGKIPENRTILYYTERVMTVIGVALSIYYVIMCCMLTFRLENEIRSTTTTVTAAAAAAFVPGDGVPGVYAGRWSKAVLRASKIM